MSRPPLAVPRTDAEIWEAVVYYAERASLVNRDSPSRKQLRKLLAEHDLTIARMLSPWAECDHDAPGAFPVWRCE